MLDKKDRSVYFIFTKDKSVTYFLNYHKVFTLGYVHINKMTIPEDDYDEKEDRPIFIGKVRSRSELKRLMRQTGILKDAVYHEDFVKGLVTEDYIKQRLENEKFY